MPFRHDPRPAGVTTPAVPIPVDLTPWRAGRAVCVDGRAWLEITRCELADQVAMGAVFDHRLGKVIPARLASPQLRLVMLRMEWVTEHDAPGDAFPLSSASLMGGVQPSLVAAGQAWKVMDRDWVCSTLAAHPRADVVDTLVRLELVLLRAWWEDATPNPETTARSPEHPC